MAILKSTNIYGDLKVHGQIVDYLKKGEVAAAIHYVKTIDKTAEEYRDPSADDIIRFLPEIGTDVHAEDVGAVYILKLRYPDPDYPEDHSKDKYPVGKEYILSYEDESSGTLCWEELGGPTDLANYYTKEEVNSRIGGLSGGDSAGTFLSCISVTEGVPTTTYTSIGTSVSSAGTTPVTGSAIYSHVNTRIGSLSASVSGSGYLTSISQSAGVVSGSYTPFGVVGSDSSVAVTGSAVHSAISNAIGMAIAAEY